MPGGGEPNVVRGALEEPDTQLRLQLRDLLAQRRLVMYSRSDARRKCSVSLRVTAYRS
jgi:hypothetical protein